MEEHSSADQKVPISIPDEACIMHLSPGVVHNFPKAVVV